MFKENIYNLLENIIKQSTINDCNLYNELTENEKLKIVENKDGSISFKILKNSILLKYCPKIKTSDLIYIKIFDAVIPNILNKIPHAKIDNNSLYAKFNIDSVEDLKVLTPEIQDIFKKIFIEYMKQDLSFGCCSHYIECSDNLKCINENIRLKLACQYKHNLDNRLIFYGKNAIKQGN